MTRLTLIIIFSFFYFSSHANEDKAEDKKKDKIAREAELVDFKKIKNVLQNDMLGSEVEKKKKIILKIKSEKKEKRIAKYHVPDQYDFWSFFSEYWLVKNTTILKWDFEKPDYGIDQSFRGLLEKLGVYELKFRILLLGTPDVAHFALPSNNNEVILLLSVPFIKALNLSKLEISILLFEDYIRAKMEIFKKRVHFKELDKFIGSNFSKRKTIDKKILKKLSKKYDDIIFDSGLSFQQQFKVTKRMDSILKGEVKLWNSYYQLLHKINNLVQSDFLYKKYSKIYPSPELQLSWLKPKKER